MNVFLRKTLSSALFLFTPVENCKLFSSDWTKANTSKPIGIGQFRGVSWHQLRNFNVYSQPLTCWHYIPITSTIKSRRLICWICLMGNQTNLRLLIADFGGHWNEWRRLTSIWSNLLSCVNFDLNFPQVTINSSGSFFCKFLFKNINRWLLEGWPLWILLIFLIIEYWNIIYTRWAIRV